MLKLELSRKELGRPAVGMMVLSENKICGWFPRRGGRCHYHINSQEQWSWFSWVSLKLAED